MLRRLYLVNAALLVVHEIDSAYWREWELFGVPGGLQGFLVLNLALVIVVLCGLRALSRGRKSGTAVSWLLVGGGLFAVVAHGFFLAGGHQEFRTPVSLALLAGTLVLSVAQGFATLGHDRS